jgi:gliding motility-associated-like protein
MKQVLLLLFIIFSCNIVCAKHITGGEVVYNYNGAGSGSSKNYTITLRLFRDNLGGGAVMPISVALGIYNNDNSALFGGFRNVNLNSEIPVVVVSKPACLINSPFFDYSMGLYSVTLDLPNNTNGYTITYQTCCRVQNIDNIGNGASGQVGSSFTGEIPGSSSLGTLLTDNSARFETGISILCDSKPFILNFSATDPDADVLQYEFYDAYNGGSAINAGYATPAAPPYGGVGYSNPFSGFQPLGPLATINSSTGIITGQAPTSGKYIVAVNVKSFRNGILIAQHKKDFIVTVAPCDFASADLNPKVYRNCDSLKTYFSNGNNSAFNLSYDWDFGEPASGINNTFTSTTENAEHTYLAAGDYLVKLIVNKNTDCPSKDSLLVKVYPGFFPATSPILPQCKNTPIQFTDLTTTNFPFVNFWKWDFGVTTLTNDTSRLKDPTYIYTTAGTYNATFIVESSKGCRDTLYPIVKIVDEPDLKITNDTLICAIDTLQLKSNFTAGNITWSPNYMISNVNSFNPLVSPDVTTTYTAYYQDVFGCSGSKKVTVSVVSAVTLLSVNDTTICRTDKAQLILNTDALYFAWSPKALIEDTTVKNPIVKPINATDTFRVKASISNKCFKEKLIIVKTIPYPIPFANDTSICFGKSVQLKASGGSSYTWSPSTYLSNILIANPIVQFPLKAISYTLSVTDTLGCPKPVSKVVTVEVVKVKANAGPSDTSIVLGQPLQLLATGSTIFLWTLNKWLNKDNIFNPISNPLSNITYKVTVSNINGCADTDTINVKVFSLPPDLYVPSAFTPANDGLNDLFRPICLGIKRLENFSVYNRWGVLLYTTSKIGDGWNGNYNGKPQDPAGYVWTATAIDYKDKRIFRKGNVVLIR